MPIVCPHCATSYAVDSEKLGTGRTVRCARCKETWVAKPEPQLAMAADVEWTDNSIGQQHAPEVESPGTPMIESPPLAAEWPTAETGKELVPVQTAPAQVIEMAQMPPRERRGQGRRKSKERRSGSLAGMRLPTSVAAMGALIAALLVWRGDVVRLMPQTAMFYKTIGLDVNLRGLSFRDVKLGNETVDGKPVLIIEGVILDELTRPLEIPRLRFVVRDAKGTAVYAWNTAPEQAVIQPGERVAFRSRLAQPPEDAHSIDVRFFNKRDLAAGAA
jgi:predicted Zn finger-like uncharacterized protein